MTPKDVKQYIVITICCLLFLVGGYFTGLFSFKESVNEVDPSSIPNLTLVADQNNPYLTEAKRLSFKSYYLSIMLGSCSPSTTSKFGKVADHFHYQLQT